MSTIRDDDKFLVHRGTGPASTSHRVDASDLMSTINPDTDWMLIQRGTDSYKVSCADVQDQLGGGGGDTLQELYSTIQFSYTGLHTKIQEAVYLGGNLVLNVFKTKLTITSSGTFTFTNVRPSKDLGYAPIRYVCIGGGGGGGDGYSGAYEAGGGGAGRYAAGALRAWPSAIGTFATFVIGAGGASATTGGSSRIWGDWVSTDPLDNESTYDYTSPGGGDGGDATGAGAGGCGGGASRTTGGGAIANGFPAENLSYDDANEPVGGKNYQADGSGIGKTGRASTGSGSGTVAGGGGGAIGGGSTGRTGGQGINPSSNEDLTFIAYTDYCRGGNGQAYGDNSAPQAPTSFGSGGGGNAYPSSGGGEKGMQGVIFLEFFEYVP